MPRVMMHSRNHLIQSWKIPQALRRQPSAGFVSRAEWVMQD